MGFALERFAEAVDPAFRCQLCGQVLEEPACTPCGHVFCASCLLPWAARRRRCPLQCQPLAPGELYRVLPLRSLVQQLRVRCDYRARGCGHIVRLRELEAHVQSCAFGPARGCGRHCSGNCCGGGGKERHQATTTQPSGDTRERALGSLDRLRIAPCRRLGKSLRTRLGLLQRRYQEKLARYMAHTRNFVGDPGGRGRGGEQKSFTVVLEREDDTLGFNIIGGRPNQDYQKQSATEGIYVSKILENGPADRADGLEVHDKIIEVNGKDLSKATHEEAVEAFRTAKEPIVVQVLRRTPLSRPTYGMVPEVQLMNASTQTDITFEHIMALAKLRPLTPPVPDTCPFLLSDSCHSLHAMGHGFYEDNECVSSPPADADRAEDFEYESFYPGAYGSRSRDPQLNTEPNSWNPVLEKEE